MRAALIVSVSVLLALSAAPRAANAQQPAPAAGPTVSAKALTRAQFLALSPDTVIDFGNERLTKREFQDRNSKAAEEAVKKLPELRQRALDAFEARRKELLDRENAALDEGNEKVRSEIARRVAADAAAQGPNWEARKQQAAELLHRAARASPAERSALEKQAADLLAPSGQ
jgi:flagellar basal body-associated protein FliL